MFALLSLCLSLAFGHVTLNPPVSTGSYAQANVRIPHGCNGTNTVAVTVTIPQGVTSVKPQKVWGWVMNITQRPLAVPITSEGGASITTEVDSVTWAQGSLPDSEYQDFGLTFKLPPATDGTKFYFPTLQLCDVGFNNWSMIPAGDGAKLSYPAPTVTVMANGTLLQLNTAGLVGSGVGTTGSGSGSKSSAAAAGAGLVSIAALGTLYLL
ncbi:hypothetical protein HDU91_005180 [Kappamyces sp. JEL0680]|nr:hypothetical protein HDU91_005180 [Kappamyces sp. JEL0680]